MILKAFKIKPIWETEVKKKFAFFPVKDVSGDIYWLESYYYMEDLFIGGYVIYRGRCSVFDSKETFYKYVRKHRCG